MCDFPSIDLFFCVYTCFPCTKKRHLLCFVLLGFLFSSSFASICIRYKPQLFVLAILETHFVCFFSTVATSLSIYLLRLVGGSIPLFSLLVFFNVPVFFLLVCTVTQQIFSSFVRVCVCLLFGKSWKNCRKDGILLLQVVSLLKATTSWKYLQGC